jgi:transposase
MIRIEFSDDDVKTLCHERLRHPHFRVRRRMEVLYLKSQGVPHKTIGERVNITKPTLTKYWRLYQTGGAAKLKELNCYRRQSALAPYEKFITDSFRERPPHTLSEASHRIAAMTGVERSPAQVRQVLKQFDRKRRKTGTIPGPALTEERLAAQEAFHDGPLTERLTEAKAGKRQVFFVDAAHFVHGAFLGMVWCLVRVWLPTPSGRKRLSVLAALNALTHQLVTVTTEGSVTAVTVYQ